MDGKTNYKIHEVKTELVVKVADAPDTKGPGERNVTVRPERVTITLDGELDAPIRHVSVSGRLVRRDGTLGRYRDIGWSPFFREPRPPAWVVDIIDREGLTWPDAWAE
ncbi:hypothetical protein [Micromonospora sp. NPDC005652]|uniref:hypothetical protein n=1 Tax=Micromonospora sp. NPDC005652 TaxID=3157046 RepID=UPI0033C95447